MAEDTFAFPGENGYARNRGMTLRDWFAGQALAGFTVATTSNLEPERYVKACFQLADAMLAARDKAK